MKKNYKIYYLSSSDDLNNIRYIGYTGGKLNSRLLNHINKSKNKKNKLTYKENWILKCLKNKKTIVINSIEENINQELIEEKEIFYINYYKSIGHNLTNLTGGGDGQKNMSEETKDKIRQSKIGLKLSDEHKKKISEAGKKRKHSEEEKIKMSLSLSGKNRGKKISKEAIQNLKFLSKTKKKVKQFNLDGTLLNIFNSISEASKISNIHKQSISACCHGRRYKSSGGFIWTFDDIENVIYNNNRETKKILQFSMDGIFINQFDSISQAHRITNINYSNISRSCKNEEMHAGGYIWKVKDIIKKEKKEKISSKPVLQYDFNNVFIKEYKSIGEATKLTNGHRRHIAECCSGKIRSSGGFKWKYKN